MVGEYDQDIGDGVAETSRGGRFYTGPKNAVTRQRRESMRYLANAADAIGNNDGAQKRPHFADACIRRCGILGEDGNLSRGRDREQHKVIEING